MSEPEGQTTQTSQTTQSAAPGPREPLRCDFCGEPVRAVRRVALDSDYERLRTPHRERYACPSCSESKEKSRIGG